MICAEQKTKLSFVISKILYRVVSSSLDKYLLNFVNLLARRSSAIVNTINKSFFLFVCFFFSYQQHVMTQQAAFFRMKSSWTTWNFRLIEHFINIWNYSTLKMIYGFIQNLMKNESYFWKLINCKVESQMASSGLF